MSSRASSSGLLIEGENMTEKTKRWLKLGVVAIIILGLAIFGWQRYASKDKDNNIVSGNGRIEAVEIDIAAKTAGRIEDIFIREGDFVTAGQTVAKIDTTVLHSQLRVAEAELQQALSTVAQRKVTLDSAQRQNERFQALIKGGVISIKAAEDATTAVNSDVAALSGAVSAVKATRANIERIQAEIDDCTLKSPRDGRVQYIVARPGEVVGGGARVLNMVDLSDVYMTFFLPTAEAGKIVLNSEVRLVMDAAPMYVIPANVSFIADVAQFTPKTVETKVEREKLMFKVRASIPSELLKKHILQVKTGLPGMAYVRLDPTAPWPAHLQERLP
jgi:HlyD family secretion protein